MQDCQNFLALDGNPPFQSQNIDEKGFNEQCPDSISSFGDCDDLTPVKVCKDVTPEMNTFDEVPTPGTGDTEPIPERFGETQNHEMAKPTRWNISTSLLASRMTQTTSASIQPTTITNLQDQIGNQYVSRQGKGYSYYCESVEESEENIRDKLALRDMLENLIKRDKKLTTIEKLLDYLNINLAGFMRRNLPYYKLVMPYNPVINQKTLEFKVVNGDGTVINCSIKEKDDPTERSPFLMSFLTLNHENQNNQEPSEYGHTETNHEILKKHSLGFNEWPIRRADTIDLHKDPFTQRSLKKTYPGDGNSIILPLLHYETVEKPVIDEKLLYRINKHIDKFIGRLSPKKDWTELKEILKSKFIQIEGIQPKKVRRFLRRFEKMIHNLDEICINIMAKKIDINFVEQPFFLTAKEIASSEASIANFIRDVAWAPLTFLTFDMFKNKPDSNFFSLTATQMILTMIAMAIAVIFYHLIRSKFVPKDEQETEPKLTTFTKTLFTWGGAALAIPGWNALQSVGVNVGLALNFSVAGAGYFSSLFPGLPEGPIQGIMSVICAYTVNHSWSKFRLRTFLKQILIFATFGAVPGDIWQVAYQVIAVTLDAYGQMSTWSVILLLGFGLASAVYIGNVAFGTGYERLINKSHLTIELEAYEDSVNLTEDLIDEDDNLVSYNGRPGAPSRASIVILKHEQRPLV